MTRVAKQGFAAIKTKPVLTVAVALMALLPAAGGAQERAASVTVQNGFDSPVPVATIQDFFQEKVDVRLGQGVIGGGAGVADIVPEGKIGVIEFISVLSSLRSNIDSNREVFVTIEMYSADSGFVGYTGFGVRNVAHKLGAAQRTFLFLEPGDIILVGVNRNVSKTAESFFVTIAGRLIDDPAR